MFKSLTSPSRVPNCQTGAGLSFEAKLKKTMSTNLCFGSGMSMFTLRKGFIRISV